jgi:hypothetical protein
VAVFVADADGQRHGHDAAAHCGPKAVEELLVVVEEDDELVAALCAERLQVMQYPHRPGIQFAITHPTLCMLALDISDRSIDLAVVLEHLHQSRGG